MRPAERAPSLRRRLTAGLVVSVMIVFMLTGAALGTVVRHLIENFVVSNLEHDLDSLLASLQVGADGTVRQNQERLTLVYQQPFSGHYFRVSGSNGLLIRSRSLWDSDFSVPKIPLGAVWQGERLGPEQQPLLVFARTVQKGGRVMTLAVAQDLTPVELIQRRVYLYFGVAGGVAILLLVLIQQTLIRRMFRPLIRLGDEVARLETGEIQSLPAEGVPAEAQPLVNQVNGLLELLAQRLQRSRKALGNLAHALKTPLTVLTQLQGDPVLADHEKVRGALRQQTVAMRGIVERELRRARLAGSGAPGPGVRVTDEVQALVKTLESIYREKGVVISAHVDGDARFSGDREDFVELLGVLLDNACKWAERRVSLDVSAKEVLRVVIADDGPGCPPEQMQSLTERGRRLDESTPGAGLGLAIAADIVGQYGGRMDFRPAELGGLEVTLGLPGRSQA